MPATAAAIESLMEAVEEFDGSVVIVTHSELILKELATSLIVFQGESPRLFPHNYQYFLEKEGWQITHDPLDLSTDDVELLADLGAERVIGAERGNEKICVEIKSFLSQSWIRL